MQNGKSSFIILVKGVNTVPAHMLSAFMTDNSFFKLIRGVLKMVHSLKACMYVAVIDSTSRSAGKQGMFACISELQTPN